MCLNAKGGGGRLDAESETLIPTTGGHFGVAHALTGEGFDASEDGTGRGTPLVPVSFAWQGGGTQTTLGYDPNSRVSGTLVKDQTQAIAFSAKDYGGDAGHLAPTMRAGGHSASHANAGVMPAIQQGMSVRRLTPRECERLQGFPDDYTAVQHRGKPAADGPRYKALGNSWAVPCARWIGQRINAVEQIATQELEAA
jgi:DNA (cytosine-5)-methyltransferase 1